MTERSSSSRPEKLRERVTAWLRADCDKTLGLCQSLIRIPTDNPPGDTRQAFNFIAEHLDSQRAAYDIVMEEAEKPNLVATIEGGEPGPHLVLNAHVDVFPVGGHAGWDDDPLSGEVRDGRLFGRGAADMKSGVAAAISSFTYLSRIKDSLRGRLTLTLVSDEETFGPSGCRYVVAHRPEVLGDCVLSAEPRSPYLIGIGDRGLIWLEIVAEGSGGHGSYGRTNAITRCFEAIERLQSLKSLTADPPLEVAAAYPETIRVFKSLRDSDVKEGLVHPTINVGRISGGTKINMVPAECRIEVDVRCPIGLTTDIVYERLEAALEACPGVTHSVLNRFEPSYSSPEHAMVGILSRNAARSRGIEPRIGVGLGSNDCRLWRFAGIPAYVYGPSPIGVGQPNEHVSLDDLHGTVETHVLSSLDYLT